MLRDTPEGFRYLKREAGSQSRKPARPPKPAKAGSREPEAGSRQLDTASLAGRADRDPHARLRRHRRSEHLAAAAVCRPELRRLQPVRDRHAVQRLFRRQLRAARVLGAVAARHALAARRARLRHRLVIQRSRFEQGRERYALDIRQRPARRPSGCCGRCPAHRAADRVQTGTTRSSAPGEVTDREFLFHAIRARTGCASGSTCSVTAGRPRVGELRAPRRLAAWGLPADGQPAAATSSRTGRARGLRALRREPASHPGDLAARDDEDRSGGHGRPRPRSFQPLRLRDFRQPAPRLPSALIRYDEAPSQDRGGVDGGGWLRLDGFGDTAEVHDPGFGPGLRNYTGFGAPIEAPAPFGTLFAVEWGYGCRACAPMAAAGRTWCESLATKSFDGGIMPEDDRGGDPCRAPLSPPA